ncbi:MAG: hypothetical protein QF902_02980 [Rhodospirillales bacterium]|jgi:hypothetical protein|nr:hypothetical protein [Rhodospirillales bacterium]
MGRIVCLLAALFLLVFGGPADVRAADGVIGDDEARIIKDYFGRKVGNVVRGDDDGVADDGKGDDDGKGKDGGLPPGLARKKELPPDLARQLDKKGALPAGLAKRDLPADLAEKLPPPPDGQQRVIVDNDVVLIEQATGVVLDVLGGVLGGGANK